MLKGDVSEADVDFPVIRDLSQLAKKLERQLAKIVKDFDKYLNVKMDTVLKDIDRDATYSHLHQWIRDYPLLEKIIKL